MGKWVNIRLEIEAAVPLEALSSVAPGIDVEEFQELLNNDPDEAIEMLKGELLAREVVDYGVVFDIDGVEVIENE
ncbi:hypothetical protein [Thermococcus kodakarensis]|uniref:hypothetical protein n=1 Tax=Thermococcus kodakarensis TaxID=311400 RepID=UPI00064F26F4|nr:hypothetical protein [Thermococcus kodakarensis]WCN28631.1 hypothetical protein POG15_03000 [Thermococcus kodakarensis]WCN30929.1 hypothetical protein POG21_03000 [Thermococcus kodakarensis]